MRKYIWRKRGYIVSFWGFCVNLKLLSAIVPILKFLWFWALFFACRPRSQMSLIDWGRWDYLLVSYLGWHGFGFLEPGNRYLIWQREECLSLSDLSPHVPFPSRDYHSHLERILPCIIFSLDIFLSAPRGLDKFRRESNSSCDADGRLLEMRGRNLFRWDCGAVCEIIKNKKSEALSRREVPYLRAESHRGTRYVWRRHLFFCNQGEEHFWIALILFWLAVYRIISGCLSERNRDNQQYKILSWCKFQECVWLPD